MFSQLIGAKMEQIGLYWISNDSECPARKTVRVPDPHVEMSDRLNTLIDREAS